LVPRSRGKGPAKRLVGFRLELSTIEDIAVEAASQDLTISAFPALTLENEFGRKK